MQHLYRLDPHQRHIYYIEAGEGPTVLLLHGNGANASLYDDMLEHLSQHFRILAPDLPGYGRSGCPSMRDLDDYINLLTQFIDSHISGPFMVIGHSLGGLLCYLLMQRGVAISRAVWMEAAMFELGLPVSTVLPLYGRLHRYRAHHRDSILQQQKELAWDINNSCPVEVERFINSYMGSDRRVQGLFLTHYPRLIPWRWEQIQQPILCLRGAKDTFISRATSHFATKLPLGHELIIPQAGHFMLNENNSFLYHAILTFLQSSALNPSELFLQSSEHCSV